MRTCLALPFLWLTACTGEEEPHVPDAANGAIVYQGNCASCHGADGDEELMSSLADYEPAAKLSEKVPEKTDEELSEGILNGVDKMPPLFLDEEDMADLIAYLRETF